MNNEIISDLEDDCEDNAEWQAELDRMFRLYKAEVKYGIHVPERVKDEVDAAA